MLKGQTKGVICMQRCIGLYYDANRVMKSAAMCYDSDWGCFSSLKKRKKSWAKGDEYHFIYKIVHYRMCRISFLGYRRYTFVSAYKSRIHELPENVLVTVHLEHMVP